MRTVIVSDLHLGTASGRDLLRHPGPREVLADALGGADRVVLLGDVLELRDSPVDDVMERARAHPQRAEPCPAGQAGGDHGRQPRPRALPGLLRAKRLRACPGPRAPDPARDRRAAGQGGRGHARRGAHHVLPRGADPGRRLGDARALPRRPQHGARDRGRLRPGGRPPIRAGSGPRVSTQPITKRCSPPSTAPCTRGPSAWTPGRRAGDSTSLKLLKRLREPRGRVDPLHTLLTRVVVPGAVGVANLAGAGNFSPDFSGPELRRAGLRAIGQVGGPPRGRRGARGLRPHPPARALWAKTLPPNGSPRAAGACTTPAAG